MPHFPGLEDLLDAMIELDPKNRPTAAECYDQFRVITGALSPSDLSATLDPVESIYELRPLKVTVDLPESRADWENLDALSTAALWESLRGYLEVKELTLFDAVDNGAFWKFLRDQPWDRGDSKLPEFYGEPVAIQVRSLSIQSDLA